MTKLQLVREISARTGVTQAQVTAVLDEARDIVREQVAETGKAVLPGVVRVRQVQLKARQAVNPNTGEKINVPAKVVLRARVDAPKSW